MQIKIAASGHPKIILMIPGSTAILLQVAVPGTTFM